MNNEKNKISQSLNLTLKKSELIDISTDLAEVALDSILDDGILKDIPILGSIVNIGKTASSIRDRLFLKKLIYFLSEVSSVDVKKREEEIKKIESDDKYKLGVGEKLLYIIDKCDDHEKANIIAKFFVAYLKGYITYKDYLKASSAINQIYIEDLYDFVENDWVRNDVDTSGHLINSGIVYLESPEINVEDQWDRKATNKYEVTGTEITVYISSLGELIRNVLRNKDVQHNKT